MEMMLDGSDKIVVFIHGFMGSPNQFEAMMKMMHDNGFSTVSVLLPGHGASGGEFIKSAAKDWETHVENTLTRFADKKEIVLVGHSIGGLLAINASTKFAVKKIVLLAAPLKFNIFLLGPNKKRLKMLLGKADASVMACYESANSIAKPYHMIHPAWIRVLLQPYMLARKTKKLLKSVQTPILSVHSKADETTSFKSARLFEKLLVNAPYEAVVLEKSWHAYYTADESAIIREQMLRFLTM